MESFTGQRREPLLTDEEQAALGPSAHRLAYPAGTRLVCVGDQTDFVLYLLSGYVKSVRHDPECILGVHRPGTLIGELAALTSTARSADLVAVTDIEAILIPADAFLKLVASNGKVAVAVAQGLAERVHELGDRAKSITSAERRLARAITEIVRSGIGVQRGNALELAGFNQRDLASLAGVSRESVSAILKQLKSKGVITTGRQRIFIHDLEQIEVLAQRLDHAH
ncbi:Crp/Fnr family transcriptional regulator [Glycomyces sp. L485]|uniref:Crp/Fnr family transcriptional regulator n=1 Tax=Glycomyces sp. L485 TaxID=2909235 RepID=UPI001F4B6615|nr:Crp/Fnr family transcriptional regulator [Glycomyces sp. L485]MCH7230980.1 Crp/Fnr family transcriptional regulator [Glycomyces sp. L485]